MASGFGEQLKGYCHECFILFEDGKGVGLPVIANLSTYCAGIASHLTGRLCLPSVGYTKPIQ